MPKAHSSERDGLLMALCRRTSRFWHFSSMLCKHVGSAAGSNKWAYALSSGMCPDHRRTKRTAPVRFAIALQSVLQETFSNTMAIGFKIGDGLLGSGFISDLVAWFSFVTGDPSEDGGGSVSSEVKQMKQTTQQVDRSTCRGLIAGPI